MKRKMTSPSRDENSEIKQAPRIISDSLDHKKMGVCVGPEEILCKQRAFAVNRMYRWLYDKGILEEHSFRFKDCGDVVYFAVDVKRLEPYREQMMSSGVDGAEMAVESIFDAEYIPCRFCGAIQLTWTMNYYRDNGGCVGSSHECSVCTTLDNSKAKKAQDIMNKEGRIAAVKYVYDQFRWKVVPNKSEEVDEGSVKRILVELTVDENELLRSPDESFADRFAEEMGWVQESGINMIDWMTVPDDFDFETAFAE